MRVWNSEAGKRKLKPKVVEAFAAPKLSFLEWYIPELSTLSVLEVGCGDGYISRALMNKTSVIGLDLSHRMLRGNPLKTKVIGSAYHLPFADNAFDLVFESNLLHHLMSPVTAVAEMKRVSKKYVALFEPNSHTFPILFFHLMRKGERGALIYCRGYLEALLREVDMEVVGASDAGWIPPNRTPTFLLPLLKGMERIHKGKFFSMVLGKLR